MRLATSLSSWLSRQNARCTMMCIVLSAERVVLISHRRLECRHWPLFCSSLGVGEHLSARKPTPCGHEGSEAKALVVSTTLQGGRNDSGMCRQHTESSVLTGRKGFSLMSAQATGLSFSWRPPLQHEPFWLPEIFWARLHVFTRLPARPARLSGERLPRQHPKPARPLERPRHRLQSEACFCFGSEMKILQVSVLHCGCATAAFGQSR